MNAAKFPTLTKHLLLVDDDRLVLSMMADGLKYAGYEVTTADSTEDVEVWLDSGQRPDLAILDVRLRGQDGLDLAQRLRDLDHIPFIMLSAFSDQETVSQAANCGALGFGVKPLDVPQLVPTIEAALARAAELHGLRATREQLQHAIDAERNVSVATGILMSDRRITRAEAFNLLRDAARKQRCKLEAVAADIVRARETLCLG